jgi:hypothetical protein
MASSTGTCRHPPLPNHPDKTNWIEKYGGLPREVDCVARALHWGSGKSVGEAIRMAWGVARNWAAGKGNVKPDTRARAAAAVAKLDAMQAAAKGKK